MAAGGRQNADTALIAALTTGATIKEAAKAAKVSERTAYRRLEDAAFKAQLAAARDLLIGETVGRLVAATSSAVDTHQELLADERSTVRLGAARSIIDQALRIREASELAERVTRLEQELNVQRQKGDEQWEALNGASSTSRSQAATVRPRSSRSST